MSQMPRPGTIEIDCPECGHRLVLDAGFAGGVARCSHCATMLNVPLVQPENRRPEAPPSKEKIERAKPKPGKGGRRYASRVDGQVGKHKGKQQHKTTRRVTAVAAILVTLGILAAIVYAGISILDKQQADFEASQQPPTAEQDAVNPLFPYDENANPYSLGKPNVMGMPVRDQCVIIFNGHNDNLGNIVQEAVTEGLTKWGGEHTFRLVVATQNGPVWFNDTFTAIKSYERRDFADFWRGVQPSNDAQDTMDAFQAAFDANPQAVVWLSAQPPEADDFPQRMRVFMLERRGPTFEGVVVVESSAARLQLALENFGALHSVSREQVNQWYNTPE